MGSGIDKTVGLDKIFPNDFVNSLFVTGLGDTAFIGPIMDSFTIAYKIMPSR
jgi:hypothetical protein